VSFPEQSTLAHENEKSNQNWANSWFSFSCHFVRLLASSVTAIAGLEFGIMSRSLALRAIILVFHRILNLEVDQHLETGEVVFRHCDEFIEQTLPDYRVWHVGRIVEDFINQFALGSVYIVECHRPSPFVSFPVCMNYAPQNREVKPLSRIFWNSSPVCPEWRGEGMSGHAFAVTKQRLKRAERGKASQNASEGISPPQRILNGIQLFT